LFEIFRGVDKIYGKFRRQKIKESRPTVHAGETHLCLPEFQSSAKLRIIFPTAKFRADSPAKNNRRPDAAYGDAGRR